MAKNKSFIDNLENFSDSVVKAIYSDAFMKSVENLWFMKMLVNSSFVKWVQSFWKWWFKSVFVFFWWFSIVVWLIGCVAFIVSLIISMLSFSFFVIFSNIVNFLLCFACIIYWIWTIKFKKRFPFITLLTLLLSIISYTLWAFQPIFGVSYFQLYPVWVIISIAILILLSAVSYAVVLKNKNLFVN